ncbi:hypothetical protein [Flavobacterium maritimum]|uniref:hypothetical protein n=1 Tax=Flavobacterium maritimum TaxID=3149042 RepID=UPI0032B35E2C
MDIFNFHKRDSKIYRIASLTAYIYSIILLLFYIYKETLYVDKTWFHGFFKMFFSIFSSIILVGILFIFSKFIDKIINYRKANALIYTYIFFLLLSTLSIILVLTSSLKVYYSQQTNENSSALGNFLDTSVSSGILLISSSIGLFLTGILLGNQIRKINFSKKLFFQILGVLFIVYKLFSLVESVNIISSEIVSGLINVAIISLIGYILSLKFQINENDLKSLNSELTSKQTKDNSLHTLKNENSKPDVINYKNKSIETNHIELENIDLNQLQHKDDAINYFKNISANEQTRLKLIVKKNYDKNFSDDEIYKLVILHISEKKLFDHNRFAPK